jgi:A/G-specific adenine glycosylase
MPTAVPWPVLLRWYRSHARDLPWRSAGTDAWAVMVSEFMLQQTPVARVRPVHEAWMRRWPTPAALAAEPPGEAVRAWGRLGYPRRALRLHASATAITAQHGGAVPSDIEALRALPGVGDYTAAAIAAFAFGRRVAVLDTNVRRVHARFLDGVAFPRGAAPTVAERERARDLLPRRNAGIASVAVMELGALVCTARAPQCSRCPVADACAWRAAGSPPWDGPRRRGQSYAGTDRQCRGALLALVRESPTPVHVRVLDAGWPVDAQQRRRALDGLVADGLVEPLSGNRYRLPAHPPHPR